MQNEINFFGIDYHDGYEGESFMLLFSEAIDEDGFKDNLKAFIKKWVDSNHFVDDDRTEFVNQITLTEANAAEKFSRNSYDLRIKLSTDYLTKQIKEAIEADDPDKFLELASRRRGAIDLKTLINGMNNVQV
ncbi:MAG: hypothetical protein ACR2MS_02240 [Weeksellaceae bacterium]